MTTDQGRTVARRTRRSGGRSANRRGTGPAVRQLPWEIPVNTDAPTEPLTGEQVQAIHDGAMRVLEEIGIEFLNEEAREVLEAAGCETRPGSTNVRMGRELVMEKVGLAPAHFTITPAQPRAGGSHRRAPHGVRQRLQPAQLLRPRPRAAPRRPRELPGPAQAHPVLQLHPHWPAAIRWSRWTCTPRYAISTASTTSSPSPTRSRMPMRSAPRASRT